VNRFFGSRKSDDTGLDGPQYHDEQNAEFHERKGPELHGAKGNGSKKDETDKEKFDGSIEHSLRLKAQSSKLKVKAKLINAQS